MKKKMYIFTLVGSPDDECFQSDLRLLAYLMYTDICQYDQEGPVIVRNKELIENRVIEKRSQDNTVYEFQSDYSVLDSRFFNPMIIGKNSFGITVYDGSISDDEVLYILKGNRSFLSFCYKCSINLGSISYDADSYEDESMRREAIDNTSVEEIALIKENILANQEDKASLQVKVKSRGRLNRFRCGYTNTLLRVLGR